MAQTRSSRKVKKTSIKVIEQNKRNEAIALKFVTDPVPWPNGNGEFVYYTLCTFKVAGDPSGKVDVLFSFTSNNKCKPGLAISVKGANIESLRNQFEDLQFQNERFKLSREQLARNIQSKKERAGTVVFYEEGCSTIESVYAQIVNPEDEVASWRAFFNELIGKVKDIVGTTPKFHGDQVKDDNPTNTPGNPPPSADTKQTQGKLPTDDDDKLPPHNLIYFGAPGTGKSFKLKVAVEGEKNDVGSISQDEKTGLFVDVKDGKVIQRRYERVTFYPTYSYAQFVGCYKPVMHGNEIAYEFVPGPFLRVLVNALNEKTDKDGKKKNWCLVIEEINRANAAAVFGDVFQLLDRKDNGESEYDIAASEDIRRYLTKEIGDNLKTEAAREFLKVEKDDDGKICLDKNGIWKSCRLRIPSNMYIWATMNSADQGVFPLDTAFKRRWEFEYIDINNGEDKSGDGKPKPEEWTIEGKEYKWNMVRKFINGLLSLHGVNEDKLMGARFVTASGKIVATKSFESKVLMYLWEDAGRMCRKEMFGDNILTYSGLVEKWENSGIVIFSNDTKKDDLKKLKDGEKLKDWYDKNANKEEK